MEYERAVSDDREPDSAASHHIDMAPPSGFRFFGIGGKKKKAEEPAQDANAATPKSAPVASVSAFAPGSGLIEEEVIEGEEVDAPGHHHKSDEHDLDDYEEETLQNQIRSGELGEMLRKPTSITASNSTSTKRTAKKKRKKKARTREMSRSRPKVVPPAQAHPTSSAIEVAVAVVVDAVDRAKGIVAAARRDAPHRPPICPSSATC